MKSCMFWDTTPCSPVQVNRRFGRNMSHSPSESNNKPSTIFDLFHASLLLGLFFDPEDGDDIFLRNVGWLSTDYTALYHRRQNFSTGLKTGFYLQLLEKMFHTEFHQNLWNELGDVWKTALTRKCLLTWRQKSRPYLSFYRGITRNYDDRQKRSSVGKPRPVSLLGLCLLPGFVTVNFSGVGTLAPYPTPNLED
jgi:hypothetical protein